MNKDERKRLLDIIAKEDKKQEVANQHFEEQVYPNMTFEEKVKYWSGTLHTQMRWQAESGLDEYAIYTPEWYQSTKTHEPQFDKIMEEVIRKYWGVGADWDEQEYYKRIGKSSRS